MSWAATDRKNRLQSGLTLIDLVVTLAIAALLVGVAIPSIYQILLNNRMTAVVNEVVIDLNYARNAAIHYNQNVVMCGSGTQTDCDETSAWRSGWIIFTDSNNDRRLSHGETLLRSHPASPEHINLYNSRPHIRFTGLGTSPGSNSTFHICDTNQRVAKRHVVLANSGRIRNDRASDEFVCPEAAL